MAHTLPFRSDEVRHLWGLLWVKDFASWIWFDLPSFQREHAVDSFSWWVNSWKRIKNEYIMSWKDHVFKWGYILPEKREINIFYEKCYQWVLVILLWLIFSNHCWHKQRRALMYSEHALKSHMEKLFLPCPLQILGWCCVSMRCEFICPLCSRLT